MRPPLLLILNEVAETLLNAVIEVVKIGTCQAESICIPLLTPPLGTSRDAGSDKTLGAAKGICWG